MRPLPSAAALLATLLFGFAPSAAATTITLGFATTSPVVVIGQSVQVDIVISGLDDPFPLEGFDLNVSFNGAVLGFDSASFGSGLGNPALQSTLVIPGAGTVNVSEFSFLTSAQLSALQSPAPLVLATVTFDAVGLGPTTLQFTGLGAGSLVAPGGVNLLPFLVQPPGTLALNVVVPEPSTALLLVAGLLALAPGRRRPRA